MNSLPYCIYHLGLRLGWRYWRIAQRSRRNPEIVPMWAMHCRMEANHANPKLATVLRQWADDLDTAYANYKSRTP